MSHHEDIRLVKNRRVMRRIFERLVRQKYPLGTRIERFALEEVGTFRFKHALHWVLKLRTPPGDTVRIAIRGNVPSRDTRQEIHVADRVQKALAHKGFAIGELRAPASFGVVPKLRLNLYENYPGETLKSLIKRRDKRAVVAAAKAGAWLAAFHRKRLRVSLLKTTARIKTEAGFFRDDVSRHAKAYSGQMIRLLDAAEWALMEVFQNHRASFRTIHGDLNLGNIVAGSDGGIGFIDFGNSWIHDPLSDIGNFLAQLDALVWTRQATPKLASRVATAFQRSYQRRRAGLDTKRRIDVHHAWWTLQILAYTLSTKPRTGRRLITRSFATASRLLQKHRYVIPPALEQSSKSDFRRTLLNRTSMLAYFADYLPRFFPKTEKVETIALAQQHALSAASFLTKYRLTVRLPNGVTTKKIIRGNSIDSRTYDIMRVLYRARRRRFDVIRPLAYIPRQTYVFYEELVGTPLRQAHVRAPSYQRLLRNVAHALARFHQVQSHGLRRLRWPDELNFLRGLSQQISAHDRGDIGPLDEVLRKLHHHERLIWNAHSVLTHNDFQASNILTTPHGIGIIDYTRSGIGHPGIDVANFRSHLYIMLDGLLSAPRIERLAAIFSLAYRRAVPRSWWPAVAASIPVFELRSTLDILATTVTNLGPGDPNRRRYVTLLRRRIDYFMRRLRT